MTKELEIVIPATKYTRARAVGTVTVPVEELENGDYCLTDEGRTALRNSTWKAMRMAGWLELRDWNLAICYYQHVNVFGKVFWIKTVTLFNEIFQRNYDAFCLVFNNGKRTVEHVEWELTSRPNKDFGMYVLKTIGGEQIVARHSLIEWEKFIRDHELVNKYLA